MTSPALLRPLALASVALLVATAASAQYKIVGPDGRVTYTDKPPAGPARDAGNPAGGGASGEAAGPLPYQTRQAASRFPVALYAGRRCAPCDQARDWLKTRGVPFTEYLVDTEADAAAMKARFGEAVLPMVTVGSQSLRGFNAVDLDATITNAGYPQQVKLFGYHWPAAVPLAPAPKAATPSAAPAPAPVAPPPPPPPTNSGGIQF